MITKLHHEHLDSTGKTTILLDVKGGESAIVFNKDGTPSKIWTIGGDITPSGIACYCSLYACASETFATAFMENLNREKEAKEAGKPVINTGMRKIVDMIDVQMDVQPPDSEQQTVEE